jgi:DNA-directed RNA polymerase specialized sigma subunit
MHTSLKLLTPKEREVLITYLYEGLNLRYTTGICGIVGRAARDPELEDDVTNIHYLRRKLQDVLKDHQYVSKDYESFPFWVEASDLESIATSDKYPNESAYDHFMLMVSADGSTLTSKYYDERTIQDLETLSDRRKSIIRYFIQLLEQIPHKQAA